MSQNSPFYHLEGLLGEDVMFLNATITESFQNSEALIPQVSRYLIGAGGKRVRPYLALGIGKLFHSASPKRFLQAASLEFLHTATLLHDDVVDHSEQRRKQKSSHLVWGNEAAILVGDFLFAKAFSLMVQLENPAVLALLAYTATAIAEGEIVQLHRAHDLSLSDEEYIAMISGKTSILFRAATETAAMLARQDPSVAQQCGEFGLNLGIAFQLADDVLDYDSDQRTLGKNIGDDFLEGKISAPALYSYRQSNTEIRAFWQRAMSGKRQKGDFERALEILTQQNILPQIQQRALDYAEKAIKALDCAVDSPMKTALTHCARFAASRSY
ncbi:MAG: polyprenyl synthetase family protein [Alphaproteobacteria bacterium]|nr:polyprenyl synthetase family protein [Alphaproteobacteria bacterium]